MKRKLSVIAAAFFVLALASLVFASFDRMTPESPRQFALFMKATGPEFFTKTQEPEGKQMVDKHLKKLQALTEKGICLFSGHTLVTDESGFGIIVVKVDSEAEAQKIIDDDDLVKAGLVRGTVFPFQVVTAAK